MLRLIIIAVLQRLCWFADDEQPHKPDFPRLSAFVNAIRYLSVGNLDLISTFTYHYCYLCFIRSCYIYTKERLIRAFLPFVPGIIQLLRTLLIERCQPDSCW